MKTKCFVFALVLISAVNLNTLHAQDEEIFIPTESQSATDEEIFVPSDAATSTDEEVIIDESDSNEVQGAGEYDY